MKRIDGELSRWAALQASIGGWFIVALGIAYLTLQLNPRLSESLGDVLLLCGYSALFFVSFGFVAGLAASLLVSLLARFMPSFRVLTQGMICSVLFFSPILYLAFLPDLGLARDQLANLIFGGSIFDKAAAVFGVLVVSVLLGLLARVAATALARFLGQGSGRLLRLAWLLVVGVAGFVILNVPGRPGEAVGPRVAVDYQVVEGDLPVPVVLLCIDGVDPRLLARHLALGELPTFARLVREGTSGSLETLEPTLSAVVWTTIATGKPKQEHQIHHFVHTRLPGMRSPILEFPLHSGLNFRTLPWLESLPWFPQLQVPYSSTMRRSQALWQIVGRFYSVGVWKWLISWPAETVHGFYVSGGVGWAQFGDGDKRREVREKSTYPSRLYRDLTKPEPLNVEERMQELAGDGLHIEADERKWNPLRGLVQDRVAHYLPQLIERFEPRFVAAAFFNLDVFHHFYGRSEGSEKELIAKSYRYVDARLGELLEELDRPVQLIVISDHGFDFEHGHHTFAPPGIFIAHGPAFGPGERVEGLSVYDVAPLVLRLLDLPLAEDMRGTRQGRYERALRPDFLGAHPVSYLDSWEGEESADEDDEKHPIDDQMRDVLESLGYIG